MAAIIKAAIASAVYFASSIAGLVLFLTLASIAGFVEPFWQDGKGMLAVVVGVRATVAGAIAFLAAVLIWRPIRMGYLGITVVGTVCGLAWVPVFGLIAAVWTLVDRNAVTSSVWSIAIGASAACALAAVIVVNRLTRPSDVHHESRSDAER